MTPLSPAPVELPGGGELTSPPDRTPPPVSDLRAGDPPADGVTSADTGLPQDGEGPPLIARIHTDVLSGDFPLVVTFDPLGSELGSGAVHYAWSFGDGAVAADAEQVVHTYLGEGEFEATLTLTDDLTGAVSVGSITVEVDRPGCPHEQAPEGLGSIDGVDGLSGIAASRLASEVYWVHEDGDESDLLIAVDVDGTTLSEQGLPNSVDDIEDISTVVDALTGTPMLFLGDFGDNDERRDGIAVLVVEEPDPWTDGELDPLRMELVYPGGPVDAETLLVDPLTMDLYILTKESSPEVFVKRAPHDDEGPFELEPLGSLSFGTTVTGGDVSSDGTRVVIRGYSSTAHLWIRDGYRPLEDVLFDEDDCSIDIRSEEQGEGIAFTADGAAVVTVGEGADSSMSYVGL